MKRSRGPVKHPGSSSENGGADHLFRIAAPVVGGMVTSMILTFTAIPAVYSLGRERGIDRAHASLPSRRNGGSKDTLEPGVQLQDVR
jgi:hypothetical protein